MTILPKGTIINGPDGQGYEMTAPTNPYFPFIPALRPFGGAPDLGPGGIRLPWFWNEMKAAAKRAEASE